ncbi:MAG: hypothetical protein JWP74_2061 [Marmoricola sp.]|nr:hypothetical protein [Marmoricola sp.]
MLKRSWLFVLPLIVGFLWVGVGPSQASGELFKAHKITTASCASGGTELSVNFSGLDGGNNYIAHTVVSSQGLVYMNEDAGSPSNGGDGWGLYNDSSYGPTNGTWPIPAGHPMKVVFTLERPKGNVLSSWTMVTKSCDSKTMLYNGLTSSDGDGDYVNVYKDKCPDVQGFTAIGCPKANRSLVLSALKNPKRVAGQLVSPGFPGLISGRTVTIWKVKPGADKKVATRKTSSSGAFSAKVGAGRYYAKSPAVIVPTSGQTSADTSNKVKVK